MQTIFGFAQQITGAAADGLRVRILAASTSTTGTGPAAILTNPAAFSGHTAQHTTYGSGYFETQLVPGAYIAQFGGVEFPFTVVLSTGLENVLTLATGPVTIISSSPKVFTSVATPSVYGVVKMHTGATTAVVYDKAQTDAAIAAGGGGGSAIPAFDTLAALKAFPVPVNGTEVILTGISAADDLIASEGGVRRYLYRSASVVSANDGAVVQPTAGGGRYIQI